jgi:hypothetical protein
MDGYLFLCHARNALLVELVPQTLKFDICLRNLRVGELSMLRSQADTHLTSE